MPSTTQCSANSRLYTHQSLSYTVTVHTPNASSAMVREWTAIIQSTGKRPSYTGALPVLFNVNWREQTPACLSSAGQSTPNTSVYSGCLWIWELSTSSSWPNSDIIFPTAAATSADPASSHSACPSYAELRSRSGGDLSPCHRA